MATHMSCAHIVFKRALEHLRIHMHACRPDVLIARNKRLPRNDNAECIHGRARVNVCGTHIGHMSAQHAIAAARTIYHQAGGMLNARARADAHLRTTLPDKPMARTIA